MLKLTNSFCRYLWLTCESISHRVHVNTSSHFSCKRKSCTVNSLPLKLSLLSPWLSAEQQQRHSSNKKKNHFKKQFLKSNALKKNKQMSESLQPTLTNDSYGGQFEITSTEEHHNIDQWKKQPTEQGTAKNAGSGTRKAQIPPNFRVWETVKKSDKADETSFRFKVISYNVLAQYLLECHPYLYTECAPNDLKWKVRASRLYDEIMNFAPDILCLQEVQASHLKTFYSKFEDLGYFAAYKQKTGFRHDGCAIFFKEALFKMLDQSSVEYYQPELPILNRDNIGLMVKLVPKSAPDCPFVVVTTHLLYNPKRTDVRLAQIQVLLAEIDRFAYYNNGRESGHLPIILTGDLNSTPESAVIRLLSRGQVSACQFRDSSDWKKIAVTDNCQHLSVFLSRQNGEKHFDSRNIKIFHSDHDTTEGEGRSDSVVEEKHRTMFNTDVVCHSLNLMSVYDRVKMDGRPEATTFQDYWVTVDYIYFSYNSNLKVLERLRLPTAEECDVLGTLPNDVFPSDHLSLGAVFEMKTRKCSL